MKKIIVTLSLIASTFVYSQKLKRGTLLIEIKNKNKYDIVFYKDAKKIKKIKQTDTIAKFQIPFFNPNYKLDYEIDEKNKTIKILLTKKIKPKTKNRKS